MKKLTILLSVLFVAFTSVFAAGDPVLKLEKKTFTFTSQYKFADEFPFSMQTVLGVDTANLPADLDAPTVKGGLDGVEFTAKYQTMDEDLKLLVKYTVTKPGVYTDSVFVSCGELKDTLEVKLTVTSNARPVFVIDGDVAVFALGDVAFADAKAGVTREVGASVTEDRTLNFAKGGADAENFAVTLNEGKLSVTFTAEEARDYAATITLSAADVLKDSVINLSATVLEKPVITVADKLEFGDIAFLDAPKGTVKELEATVSAGTLAVAVDGANKDNFAATIEGDKLKVTFTANAAGDFVATATLSAEGADSKEVALSATVLKEPKISVTPTEWKTEVALINGNASAMQDFDITVSDPMKDDLAGRIEKLGSKFSWDAKKQIVRFAATEAGTYTDTLILSTTGAKDVRVALEVVVSATPLDHIITVDPAKWETSLVLDGDKVEAAKLFTVSVTNELETPKARLANNDGHFALEDLGKKLYVSFTADKAGEYSAQLVVSHKNAKDAVVELKVVVKDNAPAVIAVTGVSLDKTSAELEIGGTLQLTATVAPENATNKNVSWASSDAAVATVVNGLVTAVKAGSATITVTTEDGAKTATCAITVKEGEVPPTPGGDVDIISHETAGMTGANNKYADFTITNTKSGAEYKLNAYDGNAVGIDYLQMRSSDNSGLVATKSAGSVVSVKIKFNSKTAAARILNIYASNTAYSSIADIYGDAKPIAQIAFADGAEQTYTFTEDFKYIGARSSNGALYLDAVEVTWGTAPTPPAPVAVESVSLDKESAELEVGKTLQLTATVLPANADNKKVSWSSSDDKVATVANGLVTAVAKGTATITVTTEDGAKTATCAITVKEGEVPPTPPTEGGWVSDPSKLKAGDKIAIANFDGTFAMSTEQVTVENSKIYRGATAFDEKNISTSVEQVELVASGNNFKLKVNGGFLYFDDAWTKNWLGTNETGSDYKFETSGDTIFIVDAKNDRVILYNAPETGDPRFSEYKKTSSVRATGAVKLFLLGEVEQKATTKLTIDPKTAEVAVGATVKLNVERDGNDELVWKSMDEAIATVANGVVTGVAEGVVKIAATANNISDTCVVTVVKASDIPTKTIAEFIAAKGGKCYLTGVVSNIKTYDDGTYNKYGNFDLTDASGKIYVYGLLSATGEKQKFQELGVDEGDTLTVIAETYQLYKETDEVVDAIFVEVKKAGEVPPQPGELLDVDYGMGLYIVDELGPFWQFAAGKLPADPEAEDLDYPIILFQFENEDATHIAGEYEIFYGILYTSDNDSVEVEYGTVEITCIEEGANGQAPYYHVRVTFTDEQGNVIGVYEFETEVYAYDAETEQEIELEDKASQGIENVSAFEIDFNAPMYNIQGMQVGRGTQGILIQNGHKFIIAK